MPFTLPARLMYLLKWNVGSYAGQGRGGGQKRSGEGPSGFCLSWGAIKTLIFTHTWCFFCDGGHLMHQLGNQRYQAGWRFTERSSAYCLTATLNIHPHRQIICCLLNHPSWSWQAFSLKTTSDSTVRYVWVYGDTMPKSLFPFITFKSGWTHQQRAIFWCESTVAARFRS